MSFTDVAHAAVPHGNVGPLGVDDTAVAFPFADNGSHDWNKVGLLPAGSQDLAVVARSRWPRGFINWVAVTGHWVAWTDQEHQQDDSDYNVRWRVWARNTVTGATTLLATNGQHPDPFVPQVHAADGYVFWTQAEPDRSARELVWRPGHNRPTAVLRHATMTPGSESVADGALVYLSRAADVKPGVHTVGGDCWSVPLDGSRAPEPLTHTALAMGCATTPRWLVWSEHIDPAVRPLPPDGVLDDPYKMVARPVQGGQARVLHRGYLPTGAPQAGSAFAAWTGPAGRPVLRALTSSHRLVLPGRVAPLSVRSGGGTTIGYVSADAATPVVHLAKVTVTD